MTTATGIVLRTLVAASVAAVVVFVAVLPAEYGYDPTGLGEALGLSGLAETPSSALLAQEQTLAEDTFTFELLPFESLEYKYRLEAGAAMVFAWRASGEVTYDLHAEPDGAQPGFAQSFAQGKSQGESGSYVAAFPGIHGWFWENRNQKPTTVTLVSSGFFTAATVYHGGAESPRVVRSRQPADGEQ